MFIFIVMLNGCTKTENTDFWVETIDVLHKAEESNSYDKEKWNIGIQGETVTTDPVYPAVTVKRNDTDVDAYFGLSNFGKDTRRVEYSYRTTKEEEEKTIEEHILLYSSDETFQNYVARYSYKVFQDNALLNEETQEGKLNVEENQLTYENVPYLSELGDYFVQYLNDFQKDFNLDYANTDFINVPSLIQQAHIPSLIAQAQEENAMTSYSSEAKINAKGYSLVTSVDVNETKKEAIYQVYNVEMQTYVTTWNFGLQETNQQHLYLLTTNMDLDMQYAIYIDGETMYLYSQEMSPQEIYNDYLQGGNNALNILSTNNKKGTEYSTRK